jgi:mono/diheme cytochrome c family protein
MPGRYFSSLLLTACFLILAAECAQAQPAGPFTQAQVTAGHKVYEEYCASCHGEIMSGFGDAPPLTGPLFDQDWSKQSAGVMFAFVSNAMPQGLEGELKPEEYAGVVAYILAANGAKPGTTAFNGKSDIKIGTIANSKLVPSVVNAPVPQ